MPARVGFIGNFGSQRMLVVTGWSADPVHPADGLALDLHVVHILPAANDGLKGGVLGPQLDVIAAGVSADDRRGTHGSAHPQPGTGSTSYATVLSGVSCREVAAAGTGAQSGAGPGFAPKSSSEICVFVGHSTAAPQSGTAASMDAASTFLAPAAFKAADEAARACHWTMAPEDKVQLPSGRTGTITSI